MYQSCYLRFECLHNQFYVVCNLKLSCLGVGVGGALIGILPRVSKWLETVLISPL